MRTLDCLLPIFYKQDSVEKQKGSGLGFVTFYNGSGYGEPKVTEPRGSEHWQKNYDQNLKKLHLTFRFRDKKLICISFYLSEEKSLTDIRQPDRYGT